MQTAKSTACQRSLAIQALCYRRVKTPSSISNVGIGVDNDDRSWLRTNFGRIILDGLHDADDKCFMRWGFYQYWMNAGHGRFVGAGKSVWIYVKAMYQCSM